MSVLIKNINYKDQDFTITVTIDWTVERRFGGIRLHFLEVKDAHGITKRASRFESKDLKEAVDSAISYIKVMVDGHEVEVSSDVQTLIDLGFTIKD